MGKKAFASQAAFATAALAGFSVFSATAQAQVPGQSWTGFYMGVNAGYGWQDVDYSNPGFNGSADPSGVAAGAVFGYNYHVAPQFVVGVEGTVGFTGIDETKLIGGAELRSRTLYDYSARLRAGFLISPQKLLFVSGGFAGARQEVSFPDLSETLNRSGYTLGFGIEKGDFIRGAHVRAEYVFSDYSTKTFVGDLPVGLTQHVVRFTISSRPEKVVYGR